MAEINKISSYVIYYRLNSKDQFYILYFFYFIFFYCFTKICSVYLSKTYLQLSDEFGIRFCHSNKLQKFWEKTYRYSHGYSLSNTKWVDKLLVILDKHTAHY